MTAQDYQDLIDRGWRRSGQYCYKTINQKCCCPMYTIRCEALHFKLSNSQKKNLRKFRNYIEKGAGAGKVDTAKNCVESTVVQDTALSDRAEEMLTCTPQDLPQVTPGRQLVKPVKKKNCAEAVSPGPVNLPPAPRDSSRIKGKLFRRQRWKEKNEKNGVAPLPRENQEKSLEDWLQYSSEAVHRFEVRLVPASPDNEEFFSTFQESLTVYQKYQVAVHGDKLDTCSANQYKRFLCKNPLIRDDPYGAYHRQYLIDGRIVAVGVVDILPNCVSSVYLYYDPDFSFLSLGTYTSLSEIAFVREMNLLYPALQHYYLGFYIHSCQKMRYKGQFHPSYLCCPESFTWQPIEPCRRLLDASPYSRLDPNLANSDANAFTSLKDVKVFHCRQMMDWNEYAYECGRNLEEEEIEEVSEYGKLIGRNLANRMLLFRKT